LSKWLYPHAHAAANFVETILSYSLLDREWCCRDRPLPSTLQASRNADIERGHLI